MIDQRVPAMASLPTASGLIGVALVIRSRDGPRFVFHFPQHPSSQISQREVRFGTEIDLLEVDKSLTEEDGSDDSDFEDGGYHLHQTSADRELGGEDQRNRYKASHSRHDHSDEDHHFDAPNGEQIVPWEHLGDFPTKDLESILTPSRAFHKNRFELSLDHLNFVSYPMHIREDGLWKKKKPKRSKRAKNRGTEPEVGDQDGSKPKPTGPNSDEEDDSGGMTMFNVVFMLSTPKDEEDERINEIYEHVVETFNKALKYAQANSNYVWKEAEMILSMKEKAREESMPSS